jgi:hypothetical protein
MGKGRARFARALPVFTTSGDFTPTRPANALPSRPRRRTGPANGVGHAGPSTAAERATPGPVWKPEILESCEPGRPRQPYFFASIGVVEVATTFHCPPFRDHTCRL